MTSNAYRLIGVHVKKNNYNLIKLYDQSHNTSNPIKTTLYSNLSQAGLLINHLLSNLPNIFNKLIFNQ